VTNSQAPPGEVVSPLTIVLSEISMASIRKFLF
jgi:hypothetical protein